MTTAPNPSVGSAMRLSKRSAFLFAAAILTLSACAQKVDEPLMERKSIALGQGGVTEVSVNPLALKDAVRFGVLSANKVLTSDIALEQRENDVVIARAALFPELFFNLNPASGDLLATGTAGIRYTLYDFGQRAAEIGAAKSDIAKAKYDLIAEIDDAVLNTIVRYIDLAVEKEQVRAARRYRAGINQLSDSVRARVQIGAASNVDLSEVEVGLIDAATAIADSQAKEVNALSELTSFIGIQPRSVASLSQLRGLLGVSDRSKPEMPASDSFATVAALQQAVASAEYNLKATKAGLLPKLGVQVGVGVDLDPKDGAIGTGVTAGPVLGDTYSLGGGRKSTVRNAQLDLMTAKENLNEETRLLRLEYAQASNDFRASQFRIQKRVEIVELNKRTLNVMKEEYELGNRSLRDLIDTEERIYNARKAMNDAYRELLVDRVALLKAINQMSDKFYANPQ